MLQANPWPSVQMTMSKRCVNVSRHSMLRQVQLLIITSPRDSGEVSTQPSLLPSFGKICGPYLENRLDEPGLICRQLQFQFWTILLFALQRQLHHSSCHRIFRFSQVDDINSGILKWICRQVAFLRLGSCAYLFLSSNYSLFERLVAQCFHLSYYRSQILIPPSFSLTTELVKSLDAESIVRCPNTHKRLLVQIMWDSFGGVSTNSTKTRGVHGSPKN